MIKKSMDEFIRNDREQELIQMVDTLAARFAKRAAKYDVEGSFPFENFADLKSAGYLKLTVPKEFGGDEISLYEMLLLQERLATGDGSTALAVGWHVGLMLNLRYTRSWPDGLYAEFCRNVVEKGTMLNNFASEPTTGSPTRGGRPATIAERVDGGWVITGRKTFSTLSPVLDQFVVTASIANEDSVGEFLVAKSEGVQVEETWDTLGMRGTGSHDLILQRAFVEDGKLLRRVVPGEKSLQDQLGNGWLLHIPACYLGIAFSARNFAVQFAKRHRPNSLQGSISELPHIQSQIGQMEAELRTARTLMYSIAERWDQDIENRPHFKTELGLVKYVATNSALSVVDKAMRIVGGLSLYRTLPLERMYRDVRAGLHNPPMDDAVIRDLAKTALSEA
ncbi:acyl-CoA/acyl-ACP dehydrogenase [Fodinisporobacter ferrooxydans]|uniref:Acyl-CoA/acyl-ACP dehydrogenase n=1 Tax=Fodinisporobacter ferrooxydans TaxID=2901836 RepID=A0ABY4CIR1_9BACL|nr:acyl-CoA/acyl-ACP dehydrogenase [Alicyclobacillaceae bacterium MYW30-H2]